MRFAAVADQTNDGKDGRGSVGQGNERERFEDDGDEESDMSANCSMPPRDTQQRQGKGRLAEHFFCDLRSVIAAARETRGETSLKELSLSWRGDRRCSGFG